jgi:Lon protease-like protein
MSDPDEILPVDGPREEPLDPGAVSIPDTIPENLLDDSFGEAPVEDSQPLTDTPMFPLGSVLVPGVAIPLHVFEPRYRELTLRCVEHDEPFGITLIERGSEVGGGDVRTPVGCLARVVEHDQFPDGRFALIALGTERVIVEHWLEDDPYPRAITTPWPDSIESVTRSQMEAISEELNALRELAMKAGYRSEPIELDLELDPTAFSHQACAGAPLGPLDRYQLLSEPGPASRLDRLAGFLSDAKEMLEGSLREPDDPPASGML